MGRDGGQPVSLAREERGSFLTPLRMRLPPQVVGLTGWLQEPHAAQQQEDESGRCRHPPCSWKCPL